MGTSVTRDLVDEFSAAYLFALRYPEERDRFVAYGERSLRSLAVAVRLHRTGETGGDASTPDQIDRDTGFAILATYTLGSIMATIMPGDNDIAGSVERVNARLFRSLAGDQR